MQQQIKSNREAKPRRARQRSAIEAIAFVLTRLKAVPFMRWLAHASGRELFELPLVKTAYIGFGVTLASLAWIKLQGEQWADYGLKRTKSLRWIAGAALLLIGLDLFYSIFLESTIDTLVLNYFGGNTHAAANTFKAVVGNLPLYFYVLPFIWVFAAFGEEFFFRGFVMTKLARTMGDGRAAWVAAVLLQAVLFGLAHGYQGPAGMVGTGITGLIYGGATVVFGRNLWPAVIAHGAMDTLGFTLLFLGAIETG